MISLSSNQIHHIYQHKNQFAYEGMEEVITKAIDKPNARLKLPPNFGKKRVSKGCGRFKLAFSLIWKKFCLSCKITFKRGYREKYYKGLAKVESHIRHLRTNPLRHTPSIANATSDSDLTASPSASTECLSPEQIATQQLLQSLKVELDSRSSFKQAQASKLTDLLEQKRPLDERLTENHKTLTSKSNEVKKLQVQFEIDKKRDETLAELQELATEYTQLGWLRKKFYDGTDILALKPDFKWNDPHKEIQDIVAERILIASRTKQNEEIANTCKTQIQELETIQTNIHSQLVPLNSDIELAMIALREIETFIHKLKVTIAVLEDQDPYEYYDCNDFSVPESGSSENEMKAPSNMVSS